MAAIGRRQILGGAAAAAAVGVAGTGPAHAAGGGRPNPDGAKPAPQKAGVAARALPGLLPGEQAIVYPGIALVAASSSSTVGTIYVSNPAAGSYPSSTSGWVGISLTPPIGSRLTGVDFSMYGQPQAGNVVVDKYLPDTVGFDRTLGLATISGPGAATHTLPLDELYDGSQGYHAYHIGGTVSNVCRAIRIRYLPPAYPHLHPITQQRVWDSRKAGYPADGILKPGRKRTIPIRDGRDAKGKVVAPDVVPPGAVAAAITVTAVSPQRTGSLAVAPGGTGRSPNPMLNYRSGVTIANGLIAKLDSQRRITLFCRSGATHVTVDVTGYIIEE